MCGGGGLTSLIEPVSDVVATLTGNPELIPLINAGETAGLDLAKGDSLGKSLGQGAISGGTALAGQEVAGALGVGQGNTAFNSAFGITGDNPAGTGLPDLGKAVSGIFGGSSDTSNISAPSSTSSSPQQGVAPSTYQVPSAGAGTGGSGTGAAGSAAPAGVSSDPLSVGTSVDSSGIDNIVKSLNNGSAAGGTGDLGTDATSAVSPNVGAGTVGTPSVAGAAAKSPSSFDNFLSHPTAGNAFDIVKANPGAAISAAGLGLDALKGNQALTGEKQIKQEASQLAGQGNQLQGYLESGTLPPGLQAGISQATESAKATIRSQYAARGMSGSSAEQQDLAAVDQRAQAQGAEMAMQLLQTGISETGMASGLYEQLLNESLKNDATLSSAISNFASAAAGGGGFGKGGITISQTA